MRRLNTTDALLLYQQTLLNDYTHSLRVTLVDTSMCAPGSAYMNVRIGMESICSRLAPFSWRHVPTPLGVHHPLWVDDPDYDMDNHFHRIGCPAPGTARELAELAATIASSPLDMSRPLWENWIVEGLADGHIAVITKVHHSLADGVAAAQMFDELCTTEPQPLDTRPTLRHADVARIPSKAARFRLAAADVLQTLLTVPAVLGAARRVRRARKDRAPELAPARGSDAQRTSLNGVLGSRRCFAYVSFAMSDVRAIKDAFGVSVNDVYVAVCAGALKRFLLERGELPDVPLIATMPGSIRTSQEMNAYGNRIGTMIIRLPTTVEDPVQRLMAAKAEADIAKADFQLAAGARNEDILDLFPPVVHKVILRAMTRVMGNGRPLMGNVVVSNVPGPRRPLFLGDMKIAAIYGIGPLMPAIALNITAWSYVDQLNVSVLTDAATIRDPWPLTEMLQEAFQELLKEASHRQTKEING